MSGESWRRRLVAAQGWFIPLAIAAGLLIHAAGLRADANWDLRNYHLYNPFALLNGRLMQDVAPAGVQSYHPPLLDVPYYLLQRGISSLAWLNAILAIPHAVAALLAYGIARRALGEGGWGVRWLAGVAAVFGATAASALSTMASTQSEMVPVSLVLGAVLLALGPLGEGRLPARRMALCGMLCGAAAGLKLTTAYGGLGFVAALLCVPGPGPRARLLALLAFGAGGAAGALLTAGHWWWTLYSAFGNPVFPYYNAVFRSPWAWDANTLDTRFFPRTALQWLAYPFFWAVTPSRLASEIPVRDPRIALGLLAALAVLARSLRRGPATADRRRERFLSVFFLACYAVWEVQFSILRYLALIELLTGTMLVLAARPWLRRLASPPGLLAAAAACYLTIISTAAHVERYRAPRKPVDVVFPPVPDRSLVLFLELSPMAYTAAFAPPGVRFVNLATDLVSSPTQTLFRARVASLLRAQAGPVWGMYQPGIHPGVPEATAAAWGFRLTEECAQVGSNLDGNGLRLCRLERVPD